MAPDEPVVFYCPGIVGKTLCASRLLGKSKLSFQLGQEVEFKKICQAVCILGKYGGGMFDKLSLYTYNIRLR